MDWKLEFEKLPEEMKQVTIRQNRAFRRLLKAEEQSNLWDREYGLAKAEHDLAAKEYGAVSLRWNPETNEMKPKLEELPQ